MLKLFFLLFLIPLGVNAFTVEGNNVFLTIENKNQGKLGAEIESANISQEIIKQHISKVVNVNSVKIDDKKEELLAFNAKTSTFQITSSNCKLKNNEWSCRVTFIEDSDSSKNFNKALETNVKDLYRDYSIDLFLSKDDFFDKKLYFFNLEKSYRDVLSVLINGINLDEEQEIYPVAKITKAGPMQSYINDGLFFNGKSDLFNKHFDVIDGKESIKLMPKFYQEVNKIKEKYKNCGSSCLNESELIKIQSYSMSSALIYLLSIKEIKVKVDLDLNSNGRVIDDNSYHLINAVSQFDYFANKNKKTGNAKLESLYAFYSDKHNYLILPKFKQERIVKSYYTNYAIDEISGEHFYTIRDHELQFKEIEYSDFF